jgi:hypothetical protein
MSIVRVGSTATYAAGWDNIFGASRAKGGAAKSAKPKAAKKAKAKAAKKKPARGTK